MSDSDMSDKKDEEGVVSVYEEGFGNELLSTRRYKAGYEVRTERVWFDGQEKDAIVMKNAYTPAGDYIGDSKTAHRLTVKLGIAPEKSDPDHCVCSIGFCEREQKWYGWSHRARYGFGVGDTAREGDLCAESGWTDEYLAEHPEEDTSLPIGFTAFTLDDAKRMAVAFAGAVS